MTGKKFTFKYDLKAIEKLKSGQTFYFPEEEHFGVKWKIRIHKWNNIPIIWLFTNMTGNQEIHFKNIMRIFSRNKEKVCSFSNIVLKNPKMQLMATREKKSETHPDPEFGACEFLNSCEWKFMEHDLNDGNVEVQICVKITKMIGFQRKELRSFGEEMKQFSDVILKVEDRKCYVSKLYLASQSPYFATLFLGKFQESGKTEIDLKGVNPQDFQCFLEVIYGEDAIDDDTVVGILRIADMFETPLAVKKCEKYLIKESKMELKEKLELAKKYRLEELKKVSLESD